MLALPDGKRVAVALTADFDAHSSWHAGFKRSTAAYMSRGEFGAEVGTPRLLELFGRFGVRTTWCTPGHTLLTFRSRVEEVIAAGHEIAAHGCYHENITELLPSEERRLMERQLEQHEQVVGQRPRGYRSPAWEFTGVTSSLLEEYGFEWDSSLMGRDFEPYYPRPVIIDLEQGDTWGDPTSVLEIPVSWYLDDWPSQEFVMGIQTGLASANVLYETWKDHFDYARERVPNAVVTITMHPQCIGRAHHMLMLERLLQHMTSFDDVWFASLSDVFDAWQAASR